MIYLILVNHNGVEKGYWIKAENEVQALNKLRDRYEYDKIIGIELVSN